MEQRGRLQLAVLLQVDVFSFGVVMWELWTGREPYEGLNYHALLHQITSSTKAIRPEIPGNPDWEGEPLPELAPGWKYGTFPVLMPTVVSSWSKECVNWSLCMHGHLITFFC